MTLRLIAVAVAFLMAASPIIGLACELSCGQPPSTSPCHDPDRSADRADVRSAPPACDYEHAAAIPAFVISSSGRGFMDIPVAARASLFAGAAIEGARATSGAPAHGPPDARSSRPSSLLTVLRI